jgi:hypothetical protein
MYVKCKVYVYAIMYAYYIWCILLKYMYYKASRVRMYYKPTIEVVEDEPEQASSTYLLLHRNTIPLLLLSYYLL